MAGTDATPLVVADVGGSPVWFESSDVTLDGPPEALASAMLIVAAARGDQLRLEDAVDATWRANVVDILEVWRRWWSYADVTPKAKVRATPRARRPGTMLCFTGGVDSFHTLLRGPKVDLLVFVQGYDIQLTDDARMAAWERSLRAISNATGVRGAVLRTNLREHELFATCDWDRSHGGALAGVGYLLSQHGDRLLISSGAPASYDVPWGSHPAVDHLWSSGFLDVVHYGATHGRLAKIREIADDEVVHRHLRVCHENQAPTGNCSRCDKCLCTMILIAACTEPDRFEVFDWTGSLPDHVDRVPRTRFARTYQELLETAPERPLAASIRALLERTAESQSA